MLFRSRDLAEVIASQKVMLARQGRHGADLEERQLLETYAAQVRRVRNQIARRPEIRMLVVNYTHLLEDPGMGVGRIALFLGEPFDRVAGAESIRPELRRQKA